MEEAEIEENIMHELNKILILSEKINSDKKSTTDRSFYLKTDYDKLRYYLYFSLSTREIMAKNIGVSSERQLRRYFENPLIVLNNFTLCCNMAKFLKISYIEMMSRIVNEKSPNLNYQSSLLDTIKIYEEIFSKESRRKLSKLILVIIENNIDIDCFYEASIFLISKRQYKWESVNRIKNFIGNYVN